MSRSRIIKHGFFMNDVLAEIPPLGRLLFAGLWTLADKEGRLEDRPKRIKAQLLPYDDCDIDDLLSTLNSREFIIRYSADRGNYIQIKNWKKHQKPHHMEPDSELPSPFGSDKSGDSGGDEQAVNESTTDRAQAVNESSTDRAQADQSAYHPTASFSFSSSYSISKEERKNKAKKKVTESEQSESNPSLSFVDFWNVYPKKTGRQAAVKSWEKLKPDQAMIKSILQGLLNQTEERQSKEVAGLWLPEIPNPSTWLNGRRWEDEVMTEEQIQAKAAKINGNGRGNGKYERHAAISRKLKDDLAKSLAEENLGGCTVQPI